jgi:hypothetical protein
MPYFRTAIVECLFLYNAPLPDEPHELIDILQDDGRIHAFEVTLTDLVGECGQIAAGPRQAYPDAICAEYLVALRKDAKLEQLKGEYVSIRLPEHEIFVSTTELLYVQLDELTTLRGEVVRDVYEAAHGLQVPDLEADFRHRVRRWAKLRIRELGAAQPRARLEVFMEQLQKIRPADLMWQDVQQLLTACLRGAGAAV